MQQKMKRLSILSALLLFFFGCTGTRIETCSDYFNNCPKPTTLSSCDKLTSSFKDRAIPEIERLKGPIDTTEVFEYLKHFEKTDSLYVAKFKKKSRAADGIYWYKIGTEKGTGYRSGNTGIITVEGCSITDEFIFALWVYDDIALLHNKRFKADADGGFVKFVLMSKFRYFKKNKNSAPLKRGDVRYTKQRTLDKANTSFISSIYLQ